MPTKKEHRARSGDAAKAAPESDAELIALAEVARQLGYPRYAAAFDDVIAGKIPARRVRGRWYVTAPDLAVLHAQRKRSVTR
jgi:hypothetical protein